MIRLRDLDRNLAREAVEILFYVAIEKEGKRTLKPLAFKGSLSLGVIRAILDNTVNPLFYENLSKDLIKKGLAAGSTVQLRAKFSPSHTIFDRQLKGTKIICEVKI